MIARGEGSYSFNSSAVGARPAGDQPYKETRRRPELGRQADEPRFENFGKIQQQMVGVAQLVEPRVVIPVVVGSNPIAHPTL